MRLIGFHWSAYHVYVSNIRIVSHWKWFDEKQADIFILLYILDLRPVNKGLNTDASVWYTRLLKK